MDNSSKDKGDTSAAKLLRLIEWLTGQDAPLQTGAMLTPALSLIGDGGKGLGHGQLNELLLSLGYDRVSHEFFQYLVDGSTSYNFELGATIPSLDEFAVSVDRFRTLGMHLYGNVKFAFKTLSANTRELQSAVDAVAPRTEESFKARHDPIHPIEKIASNRTYFLGKFIIKDLEQRLKADPTDPDALEDQRIRDETVAIGRRNYEAYLVSDHLDVYVATSMRLAHEYQAVHETTEKIFGSPQLQGLKLRYFDPTQADCTDRIDKGIAEALMLKRAKCTVYFVGESDTLGKDSELASTLAQGKPVIAYVPEVPSDYAKKLLARLTETYPKRDRKAIFLDQLQLFDSKAAWNDPQVRKWIDHPETLEVAAATDRLQKAIQTHYDSRAHTLRELHPLGVQVNLSNGVANGVMVVREVRHCAELVKDVVLRTLKFDIEEKEINGSTYFYLRERISRCVFRVVTGDRMLMNSFWNFYLSPPAEPPAQRR